MDAHLDGGSSAPLYQQVLDLLKSDIEQGTYPVDSQIPTELELSKMYGVGRVTVRRAIEELVGEIYDESDEEDTSLVKISDGVYEASAELSVSDFLERIGLPEDTIETERTSLGGWIMDMLDRLPEQNEVISCPPFEMTVKMEDEQKIDRIRFKISEEELENKNTEDENA